MSGIKKQRHDNSDCVFEYVSGTLRGQERLNFSEQIRHDKQLESLAYYWESQLISLQPFAERKPYSNTWQQIADHINVSDTAARKLTFFEFYEHSASSVRTSISSMVFLVKRICFLERKMDFY